MNRPIHSTDQLIIFSRYPQPGTTKTRLIPALGAEGAAEMQRQMTEHTLAQAIALEPPPSITLCFAGGDRQRVEAWLGSAVAYQPQSAGDLGDRMAAAFQSAFEQGFSSVVVIGTDCPDLNTARLAHAFALLKSHDGVLGPATDGGYYLIGLSQFYPELFQGMEWGSDRVFQRTVERIEQLGLVVAYLDPLTDIDRPGDLAIWERVKAGPDANPENGFKASAQENTSSTRGAAPMPLTVIQPKPTVQDTTLSVIIPTLNEAARIAACLAPFQGCHGIEVIVADGGSRDGTGPIAQSHGATVIATPPGRARQMNAGAAIATGQILLFLHADTQLPQGFDREVRQTLNQPNVVAGAFHLHIDGSQPGLRWVEWGVKWRSRLWQLPYGDQALFLKADLFHALGGFADLPIMEDFELVQRLKRQGRVAIAPGAVSTSARRWQRLGLLQTTLINQLIVLGYRCGISPLILARWYRRRTAHAIPTPPPAEQTLGRE